MVDRPELDEFLSALNGFLDKPSPASDPSAASPPGKDPSHLRFLEIFLRSVGSSEGHLLNATDADGLRSATTFGIRPTFEKEFNELMSKQGRELTPLDAAYRDQQVVAVVEIKRGIGIPPEFLELMSRYDFKALIAVPLMGQRRAVGLLCAYYRDVCLFDRNTVERLMTIGRMVGAATEKSVAAGRMASLDEHEKTFDDYLATVTRDSLTRARVYELLAHAAAKALQVTGLICGPLQINDTSLSITVADGTGIPASSINQRFALPPVLAQQLLMGEGHKTGAAMPVGDWGAMRPLITGPSVSMLCQPILWRKKAEGAVLAWRSEQRAFSMEDTMLLKRLAGLSSLALRAV
jgi:hypothetical protein